jgi:hypothetical protein
MLQHARFVLLGLGVVSRLLLVRPLHAQVSLTITSVNVNGTFDSFAECAGSAHDPDPLVVSGTTLTPVLATSQALATNLLSTARGTAQTTAMFYQLGNGAIQISGQSSVGTLCTVLLDDPLPGDQFAAADAAANLNVTIGFEVSRWSLMSFAGTMTIGAVTAVGSPEFSTASLGLTWELRRGMGRQIIERSVAVGSSDEQLLVQDTYYNTVLVGPGAYTIHLRIDGEAAGALVDPGVTGWSCTGTFGLAVSVIRTCAADWDRDGILDSRDYFEFLNGFFLEATDFNEDSVVDSRDLFDFINAYMMGCE